MSRADLAERVTKGGKPLSVHHLIKLEIGERKLTQEWLEAIALALNVTPGELLPNGKRQVSERADGYPSVQSGNNADTKAVTGMSQSVVHREDPLMTPEELTLLARYRSLSNQQKAAIDLIIDSFEAQLGAKEATARPPFKETA